MDKEHDENWLIRSARFTYNYQNLFKPFFVNLLLFTTTIILPAFLFLDKLKTTQFYLAFKGYIAGMEVLIFAGICTDIKTKVEQTIDWIDGVFTEIRKKERASYRRLKLQNYKKAMYDLRGKAIIYQWSKKKIIAKACLFIVNYNAIFILIKYFMR